MKIRNPEIFFSILFLVLGVSWIYISGFIFPEQDYSATHMKKVSQYANSIFVLLVATILYLSIHFYRKRLLVSESKYKIVFETSPLPMWIFNIETAKFLLVNKAMINKYGYTRKELLNMSAFDIRPVEEVKKFIGFVSDAKEGILDAGIWTHKKKSGELFTVQIRTAMITYQKQQCFLVVADDISDLIKQEAAIERLSLVAKHTLNGIIITGKDRRIEWVNDSFIEMTGYSFGEVIGRIPTDLLHGIETSKTVEMEMAAAIAKGLNFSGEILNYKKDGSSMWVQTTVSPVEVNGTVDKYVAIFLDITERKRQETLIMLQNQRLREIAFASSHFIRAPLSNILGLTQLLKEDPGSVVHITAHLQTSAEHLDYPIHKLVSQASDSE